MSRTNTASDPTTVKTEVTEERTLVPTSTPDIEIYEVRSGTTTASAPPPPTTKMPVAGEGQEESISEKAREAGRSLKDLISSLGKRTKEITEEKAKDLRDQSVNISTTADAHDIQYLGNDVEKLVNVFEDTLTEIRKEPYDEQESLLVAYKRLLEEQIRVINARLELATRLKPGA